MTETFFSCVWPTCGDASRLIWIGPPLGRHEGLALAAGHVLAERDLDVGLGELVGEEALDFVVGQSPTDDRVQLVVRADDRAANAATSPAIRRT